MGPSDNGTPDQPQATAPAPPATTPPVSQPATPATTPDQDWAKATDASAPAGTAQPAPAPTPVTAVPVPPADAKRIPRPGLGGFIDKMVDSLAGTDTSKIRQDAQGNVYIDHPALTRGQQWLKIGAEAFRGAAAGMAQRGRGSEGQALEAGVQAQQRAHQAQSEEQKQQLLELANIATLNHQTAANAFEMTRKGIEATQHDVEYSEKQADRLTGAGADMAGHVSSLQDLTKFMRETPDFSKDQAQKAIYTPVATFDAQGKPNGFDIYKKLPGSDEEILPAGTQIPFFNPVKNEIEYQKSASPMKQGAVNALWAAAGNAQHKYKLDQADIEEKKAETVAKATPPPPGETDAQRKERLANANKANAEAATARANLPFIAPPGSPTANAFEGELAKYPPATQQAVKGLLNYQTDPATFPQRKYAKAGQMDRETAIGLAQMMDSSYDEKQYGARHKLLQEFTSGTGAKNIVSLNTAIQHLDRMAKSGAALGNSNFTPLNWLRNTAGPAVGATAPGVFKNDLNAVANEMATLFKRTAGTDQEIASWKNNMSVAQTPDQIRKGIDEMLQLMSGRYDALDSQYSTGMGRARDFQLLSPNSVKILTNLGATEMLQKEPKTAAPQAAATVKIIPGEPTAKLADGRLAVVRNGQWVPAQQ